MSAKIPAWVVGCALFLASGLVWGQTPPPPAPTFPVEAPPSATVIAATVNGQPIQELAVFRALTRVPPERRDEARKEILGFIVDNTIIDQYLGQLKIQVEQKEVDEQVNKIKKEADKDKQDFVKMLGRLYLTEDDLRRELTSALRWDKFVVQQGTDKALRDMFDKNIDMFNGSRVQAKHILLATKDGQVEAAQLKAAAIKKKIESDVSLELSKLPPTTSAIAREQQRSQVLDKSFAALAAVESTCPSKKQGGDLGYFPRVGMMVEPFSKAAFALKPYQLSEPVTTDFGVHLILAIDHKAGKDVKFEDVKPFVQEVYGDRLRDAVLAQYRPRSKIAIEERKK